MLPIKNSFPTQICPTLQLLSGPLMLGLTTTFTTYKDILQDLSFLVFFSKNNPVHPRFWQRYPLANNKIVCTSTAGSPIAGVGQADPEVQWRTLSHWPQSLPSDECFKEQIKEKTL